MNAEFSAKLQPIALQCAVSLVLRSQLTVRPEDVAQKALLDFARRFQEGKYPHLPAASDGDCRRVLRKFCEFAACELQRKENGDLLQRDEQTQSRLRANLKFEVAHGAKLAPTPDNPDGGFDARDFRTNEQAQEQAHRENTELTNDVRAELTADERALFDLRCAGLTRAQIAVRLNLTPATVTTREYRLNFRLAVLALERVLASAFAAAEVKPFAQGLLNRLNALKYDTLTDDALETLEKLEAAAQGVEEQPFRTGLREARCAAFNPRRAPPPFAPPDDGDTPHIV